MSSKTVANHLHRYRKVNIGENGKEYLVYRCTKPSCTHYVRLDMAEGKLCECNRCGGTMLIGRETMSKSSGKPMALPHCSECIKRRANKNVDTIKEFLERVEAKAQVNEEI